MSDRPTLPLGTIATVEEILVDYPCPMRVWVAPSLFAAHGPAIGAALGGQATVQPIPSARPEGPEAAHEPAILALTAADLRSSRRTSLLELQQRARPGRPVVYGGSRDRETLLDAINVWQAFRLVPGDLPLSALIEALHEAHHALAIQHALERCVAELDRECDHLRSVVAELKLTQERLLHGERLAAIGKMTATLLERVQQHYGSMQRFAEALRPLADRPGIARVLQHAVEGTRSIDVLLRDLIALAENRHEALTLGVEPLDQLVERTVALFRLDPAAREHEFQLHCASHATVRIDRYRTYHALMNLLRNAVQAARPDQPIEVSTTSEPQSVVIEVRDHGPGIAPDELKNLFRPFFSTKGKAGTGLGLRMSKATVERQGGGIECVSTPGEGTCFRIRLPRDGGREPRESETR